MLEKVFVAVSIALGALAGWLFLKWRSRGAGRTAGCGTVFVCQACGKRSHTRDGREGAIDPGWDTSCRTWAVLVQEDTIVLGSDGRVRSAVAA